MRIPRVTTTQTTNLCFFPALSSEGGHLIIYPDKHEAHSSSGQLKPGQKIRALGAVLLKVADQRPIRVAKQDQTVSVNMTHYFL